MLSIFDTIKEFEKSCAYQLDKGISIAAASNAVYGSRQENSFNEDYFTKFLINTLTELRRNNVLVLTSPEKDLGSDLEIHVLHQIGAWTGLRLQAKRARIVDGVFEFPELSHSSGRSKRERPVSGTQNGSLAQNALDEGMIPLYLYYLPDRLVNTHKGWTGAMVGTAWDANFFIENKIKSATTILRKNTMSLSHMLRPLDESTREFAQRVEQLFIDHVEPIDQTADLSDDIEEEYPGFAAIEDSVFEYTLPVVTSRTPPASIKRVFDGLAGYKLSEGVRAAVFFDGRAS